MLDDQLLSEFDAAHFMPAERGGVAPPHAPSAVVLACGSELKPEPVEWLWTYWLALGKVHILAGAPGQGKTTIAVGAIAATVTTGGRWPDGSRCAPGNVIVWSGEDDPADTLLPRFLAAGGDPKRIYFVKGRRDGGGVRPFDPAQDMSDLLGAIRDLGGARLVIVDPVVSAVTGDSHKNTEVRRALQPLVDGAAAGRFAVLGITHFSKGGQGSDPAQRVVGSIAFTAVARVVLVAAKVRSEDGEEKRIFARSKSNIGPDDGGFEYHLEQTEPLPGIQASRIEWGAAVTGSARELLTDPADESSADGTPSARDTARDFLMQLLADGPTPTKTVQVEAKEAGISWATVRRASEELTVIKRKSEGGWYWSLPKLLTQVAQDAQRFEAEQVEQVGEQVTQVTEVL